MIVVLLCGLLRFMYFLFIMQRIIIIDFKDEFEVMFIIQVLSVVYVNLEIVEGNQSIDIR